MYPITTTQTSYNYYNTGAGVGPNEQYRTNEAVLPYNMQRTMTMGYIDKPTVRRVNVASIVPITETVPGTAPFTSTKLEIVVPKDATTDDVLEAIEVLTSFLADPTHVANLCSGISTPI
jgi:hypothetical protein